MKRGIASSDLRFSLGAAVLCSILLGAAPATQPIAQVRIWFDQLADPLPKNRETAMDRLLAMSSADLPTLRKVVQESLPLRPSQRAALRDIVQHLYRSTLKYDPYPNGSVFLGVTCRDAEFDPITGNSRGVLIASREPGFAAFRLLQDGDVVTRIENLPDVPLDKDRFVELIRNQAARSIKLRIDRAGMSIVVDVPLNPRPVEIDINENLWRSRMEYQTNEYWDKNFRPLLGDELS